MEKDFFTRLGIKGLTAFEVNAARKQFGPNAVTIRRHRLWDSIRELLAEPMLLLLIIAASLYFIAGEIGDAIFMTVAIFIVSGISLFQESRSRKALNALKSLTRPVCRVIRDGSVSQIKREEIVIGDYMIVEEGESVPADGTIIYSHDLSVNESILTGESGPAAKQKDSDNNTIYQGTTVSGGLAIGIVNAIGAQTALGKIGKSLESIDKQVTPLQLQIRNFVRAIALGGMVIFLLVWGINYSMSHEVVDSLLKALTLAMSILPEEIPVAFTTFMALGAWRLMKLGIIVGNTRTIETLGSATVICTDKTGTITENEMNLVRVFDITMPRASSPEHLQPSEKEVITTAMWASEPIPFDPMEKALHRAYAASAKEDERHRYTMIHEYPLEGRPPMMTHIFQDESGHRIVAAKGAPESIFRVCKLDAALRKHVDGVLSGLTAEGYRVLAVANGHLGGNTFPEHQEEIRFELRGLVAFFDPPKPNIATVFESFYKAGISVKILTGDNPSTTMAIARQINFKGSDEALDGADLLTMDDETLKDHVIKFNLFTRMFPEAKLRILNGLKAAGHIVAMTGDGVNDAPALKAAHIGIAMGIKGTETAREVSSLILTDDDLSRMVDAIAMGRKIYTNLKKAVQYIISIHIPIILTVFIPLVLGWAYPVIFTPVHIIFLELIMGPTCSIIYENEPAEENIMFQPPRPATTNFFNMHELTTSIVQGLVITAGVLAVYQTGVSMGYGEPVVRGMLFLCLISANIFLTLTNRSFYYSILHTRRYKNNLIPLIIGLTVLMTTSILFIPAVNSFFELRSLTAMQIVFAALTGFLSVVWFELVKYHRRKNNIARKSGDPNTPFSHPYVS